MSKRGLGRKNAEVDLVSILAYFCQKEDNMQFLTTSELRKPEAWQSVQDEKALVTNHGKPIVLMIPVTGEDFEETLEMINKIEATRALTRIQAEARKNGNSEMTLDEINAEIAASRKERKDRQRATSRP
jgi:antitoxin (DNA-binding transcriptional repressor) of toxin-antitoxin stability system